MSHKFELVLALIAVSCLVQLATHLLCRKGDGNRSFFSICIIQYSSDLISIILCFSMCIIQYSSGLISIILWMRIFHYYGFRVLYGNVFKTWDIPVALKLPPSLHWHKVHYVVNVLNMSKVLKLFVLFTGMCSGWGRNPTFLFSREVVHCWKL